MNQTRILDVICETHGHMSEMFTGLRAVYVEGQTTTRFPAVLPSDELRAANFVCSYCQQEGFDPHRIRIATEPVEEV